MALEDQKSFGELLRDAAAHIGEIVRSEFQLASLELREAAANSVAPLRATIVGAVLSMYALESCSLAIMFLFANRFAGMAGGANCLRNGRHRRGRDNQRWHPCLSPD